MVQPPAGLEDLLDPGGGDVDPRATLLRVLTDLYMQRTTHTPRRSITTPSWRCGSSRQPTLRSVPSSPPGWQPAHRPRTRDQPIGARRGRGGRPHSRALALPAAATSRRSPRNAAAPMRIIAARGSADRGPVRPTHPRDAAKAEAASCRTCSTRRSARAPIDPAQPRLRHLRSVAAHLRSATSDIGASNQRRSSTMPRR